MATTKISTLIMILAEEEKEKNAKTPLNQAYAAPEPVAAKGAPQATTMEESDYCSYAETGIKKTLATVVGAAPGVASYFWGAPLVASSIIGGVGATLCFFGGSKIASEAASCCFSRCDDTVSPVPTDVYLRHTS